MAHKMTSDVEVRIHSARPPHQCGRSGVPSHGPSPRLRRLALSRLIWIGVVLVAALADRGLLSRAFGADEPAQEPASQAEKSTRRAVNLGQVPVEICPEIDAFVWRMIQPVLPAESKQSGRRAGAAPSGARAQSTYRAQSAERASSGGRAPAGYRSQTGPRASSGGRSPGGYRSQSVPRASSGARTQSPQRGQSPPQDQNDEPAADNAPAPGTVAYHLGKPDDKWLLDEARRQSARRTDNDLHSYVRRQCQSGDDLRDSGGSVFAITGVDVKATGTYANLSKRDIVSRFGTPRAPMTVGNFAGGMDRDEKNLKWVKYDYISFAFTGGADAGPSTSSGKTSRRAARIQEAEDASMRLVGVRVLFPDYLLTYALGDGFARQSVATARDPNAAPDASLAARPGASQDALDRFWAGSPAANPGDERRGPGLVTVRSVIASRVGPRVGGPVSYFDPNTDVVELSEGSFLYVVLHIVRAPAQWDFLNLRLGDDRHTVYGLGDPRPTVYAWTHAGLFHPQKKPQQEPPSDPLLFALVTGRLLETEHDVLVIFKGDFSKTTMWYLSGRCIGEDITLGQGRS
jgi:hypothetical protein